MLISVLFHLKVQSALKKKKSHKYFQELEVSNKMSDLDSNLSTSRQSQNITQHEPYNLSCTCQHRNLLCPICLWSKTYGIHFAYILISLFLGNFQLQFCHLIFIWQIIIIFISSKHQTSSLHLVISGHAGAFADLKWSWKALSR